MSAVVFTVTYTVKPESLSDAYPAAVKALQARVVPEIASGACLRYHFSAPAPETRRVTITEVYATPDAARAHLGLVGDLLPALSAATEDFKLVVVADGEIEELKAAGAVFVAEHKV
eukprot:TRINITY_DN3950_c0_g1_i1.p1 TRINITY_DN3950_c0_g1~~TRINITY_DN3950_c0_g1_i1.p1  ORF type:complete len:129 (-),score=26.02 TRINITY_DN3950_c0_g1_i1:27-374(-)